MKRGSGMLIMTGNNTYSGGTTVEDGALYGFSESFGSGNVNVNGGVFGVLSSFNDNFTQKVSSIRSSALLELRYRRPI